MKGICGIDINTDRIFISFAAEKKSSPVFRGEIEVAIPLKEPNILEFLKEHVQEIVQQIRDNEKTYGLKVEKVYLKLPWGMETVKTYEETISLKARKKIAPKDISFAKKALETAALDWDDFCVHHFPVTYGIEGKVVNHLPIGLWTRKIRLKSNLVVIKDKLRRETKDMFDNLEMGFEGFVAPAVSAFSGSFIDIDNSGKQAVVSVGYDQSHLVIVTEGVITIVKSFDFGLKGAISILADKFSLPFSLAQKIFDRYVFLQERPIAAAESFNKEVSVKSGDSYINLSINSLNTTLIQYIENNLQSILGCLDSSGVTVSFLGRLNAKEGFRNILEKFVSFNIAPLPYAVNLSSSFGCLRYGALSFLEKDRRRKRTLMERLMKVYKEYF
ncbi:MAG: hypothetical protein GY858_07280 [Candidatus Omnitrophica bacterium]|nr:hypothetical protein [Candidatus Omnitrophota bacterium]